jgi:hypothetical protein
MTPTTRALAPLAALFLTLALACSNDTDDPPPSSTSTTVSPEAEVEAAYLAYWDMVDRLTASPEPNSAEIAEHTADPAKDQLIRSIASLRDAGHAIQGGEQTRHDIRQVVIEGQEARLQDCYVDDSVTIEVSSGSPLETRLATDLLEVTFTRDGGEWLPSEVNVLDSWDGVVPCGD